VDLVAYLTLCRPDFLNFMLEMDGAFVEVLDADFPAVLGHDEAFGAGFGVNVGAAQVGDDAGGAGNGAPTGHGVAGQGNTAGGRL
jgi:hypothetical protein